jgi:hypothetical protein
MRFLADENVPFGVVEESIAAGHDAEWVGKLAPGAPAKVFHAQNARRCWSCGPNNSGHAQTGSSRALSLLRLVQR